MSISQNLLRTSSVLALFAIVGCGGGNDAAPTQVQDKKEEVAPVVPGPPRQPKKEDEKIKSPDKTQKEPGISDPADSKGKSPKYPIFPGNGGGGRNAGGGGARNAGGGGGDRRDRAVQPVHAVDSVSNRALGLMNSPIFTNVCFANSSIKFLWQYLYQGTSIRLGDKLGFIDPTPIQASFFRITERLARNHETLFSDPGKISLNTDYFTGELQELFKHFQIELVNRYHRPNIEMSNPASVLNRDQVDAEVFIRALFEFLDLERLINHFGIGSQVIFPESGYSNRVDSSEKMSIFQLNIDKTTKSISDAIKSNLNRDENIQVNNSFTGKKLENAIQRKYLTVPKNSEPPTQIILQLRRFEYFREEQRAGKVTIPVEPSKHIQVDYISADQQDYTHPDLIIKQTAKYSLKAVIVHLGEFSGGHYVVYTLNERQQWIRHDDQTVTVLDADQAQQAIAEMRNNGYFFLYE